MVASELFLHPIHRVAAFCVGMEETGGAHTSLAMLCITGMQIGTYSSPGNGFLVPV